MIGRKRAGKKRNVTIAPEAPITEGLTILAARPIDLPSSPGVYFLRLLLLDLRIARTEEIHESLSTCMGTSPRIAIHHFPRSNPIASAISSAM